jgi:hypothetical protein
LCVTNISMRNCVRAVGNNLDYSFVCAVLKLFGCIGLCFVVVFFGDASYCFMDG